jgi:hypothetical protein
VIPPLDRIAVVFQRPLPYLYLARQVFADAQVPYQALDALPLAAEPFAAALDIVFSFAAAEATRGSLVELLRGELPRGLVDRRRRGRPGLGRGRGLRLGLGGGGRRRHRGGGGAALEPLLGGPHVAQVLRDVEDGLLHRRPRRHRP